MLKPLLTGLLLLVGLSAFAQSAGQFVIKIPDTGDTRPLDGRLLLFLSTKEGAEPRFQIKDEVDTQQLFGMDVENVRPGQVITFSSGHRKSFCDWARQLSLNETRGISNLVNY